MDLASHCTSLSFLGRALVLTAGLLALSACKTKNSPATTAPENTQEIPAAPEGPRAPENGQAHCPAGKKAGDSWPDDCNTCTCGEDGKVYCTLMGCMDVPAPPQTPQNPTGFLFS